MSEPWEKTPAELVEMWKHHDKSRPKDWVKYYGSWIRSRGDDIPDEANMWLYAFAYWLEGQDRSLMAPRAEIVEHTR